MSALSSCCCYILLLLSFVQLCYGSSWELTDDYGEPLIPGEHIFAISLEAHNAAFSSSAYCLQHLDGPLNGLNNEMCSKCHGCVWKLREGFTTEEEWRIAVKEEITRMSHGNQKIGTWIVEAPARAERRLDRDFISELEVSLHLSLRRFVTSANRRSRYFVVSGTLEEVCLPLKAVGFPTCTPRPASLRIHPALLSNTIMKLGLNNAPPTAAASMDIHVSLVPPPPHHPTNDEAAGQMRANALANSWSGIVATSVGHMNGIVRADGTDSITIERLTWVEAGAAASSIASLDEVDSILPVPATRPWNRFASSIVQGDSGSTIGAPSPKHNTPFYPLWDMGIHGEEQIIGVADFGLDWNHCFFDDRGNNPSVGAFHNNVWESTVHRKIRQYATNKWINPAMRPLGDKFHGTHVCGTIAGTTGQDSDGNEGIAFAAKLAFYDIHKGDSARFDRDLFPISYSVGARIHSNSWGDEITPGYINEYGIKNKAVDQYMYDHQDFVIIFAAGNKGSDPGTALQPGTAKNCIAVGASKNINRGSNILHKNNLAAYSGRPHAGWSYQARRMRAWQLGEISTCLRTRRWWYQPWRCMRSWDVIRDLNGPTPVVAGATALVRQYFMEGYYPDGNKNGGDAFTPMGALLKAVVVNSAGRMVGVEATRQGSNLPSMDFGFGLVAIDSTLTTKTSPSARKLYVDGEWTPNCAACPSVNEGDAVDYIFEIAPDSNPPTGLPLKITLVWSDYPAEIRSTTPLINDLDLTLRRQSRGGSVTYSNGGSGLDTKNTVEHITVAAPRPGTRYNITVEGTDVAYGPQPYAIVISGPFEGKVTKNIHINECDQGGVALCGGKHMCINTAGRSHKCEWCGPSCYMTILNII